MIKTRRTKRASSPELNSKLSSLHALSRGAAGIRVISQMLRQSGVDAGR